MRKRAQYGRLASPLKTTAEESKAVSPLKSLASDKENERWLALMQDKEGEEGKTTTKEDEKNGKKPMGLKGRKALFSKPQRSDSLQSKPQEGEEEEEVTKKKEKKGSDLCCSLSLA